MTKCFVLRCNCAYETTGDFIGKKVVKSLECFTTCTSLKFYVLVKIQFYISDQTSLRFSGFKNVARLTLSNDLKSGSRSITFNICDNCMDTSPELKLVDTGLS